jgi:hypothetical protein
VFEGSVEVVQAGERDALVAGAAWDSAEHVIRTAAARRPAFDDEVTLALARRRRHRHRRRTRHQHRYRPGTGRRELETEGHDRIA